MPKKGEHCSDEMKAKISASKSGDNCSEETRAKISKARSGKPRSEETKAKISAANIGENNPMYGTKGHKCPNFGKTFTEEHKAKIAAAQMGEKNHNYGKTGKNSANYGKHPTNETKEKIAKSLRGEKNSLYGKTGKKHPMYGYKFSAEQRQKMSDTRRLEKHHNWQGGISFEPYCPKFNDDLKRRIRSFFDYECVLCNKSTEENKQQLSCHHVEYSKLACCDGKPVYFAALCIRCHTITNYDRPRWEAMLHRIIDEIYGGRSYWTKDEYRELLS
jgi:hypothetical protein